MKKVPSIKCHFNLCHMHLFVIFLECVYRSAFLETIKFAFSFPIRGNEHLNLDVGILNL